MTDEEFIEQLESCRLPEIHLSHSEHVRAGYLYLRCNRFPEAVVKMCNAIRNYTQSLGKAERYHETITIGFMALIQQSLKKRESWSEWEEFKAANPNLFAKGALRAYYPAEILDSPAARSSFVLPPPRYAALR
jgi:hypothetical protein